MSKVVEYILTLFWFKLPIIRRRVRQQVSYTYKRDWGEEKRREAAAKEMFSCMAASKPSP